jgi:hypothetical protein
MSVRNINNFYPILRKRDFRFLTDILRIGYFYLYNIIMKKILLNLVQKTGVNYKKYFALIDAEDYDLISKYNWSIDHYGYVTARIDNVKTKMHVYLIGKLDGKEIDHINGIKTDNRRSNLRHVTRSQNRMNTDSRKNTSSKFKGVSWHKAGGKWHMQIHNGNTRYTKLCNSEQEAALLYNEKAKEIFGNFAKLNLI